MPRPLIDAHRGAPDGFEKAFAAGYDYVEFDVRRAPSGRLVIQHDPNPPEDALPLHQLLEMAAASPGRLHVDLKEPGCVSETVRTLFARGFGPDRFVVTGADSGVREVKDEFPEVQAGLSLGEDLEGVPPWHRVRVRFSELFPARRVSACRADFVAVDYRLAGYTVLRYCARAGLPAWVWTVDDEAQMRRFLRDPRVAVLITNHPDVARRVLAGAMPAGA